MPDKEEQREANANELRDYKTIFVGALLMEYAKDPDKFKEELLGFFVDFEGAAGIPALQLRNLGIMALSEIANAFTEKDWEDLYTAAETISAQDYSDDPEQEILDFLNCLKEL